MDASLPQITFLAQSSVSERFVLCRCRSNCTRYLFMLTGKAVLYTVYIASTTPNNVGTCCVRQTNATLLATTPNIVRCDLLRPFAHPVAYCCAKFETGQNLALLGQQLPALMGLVTSFAHRLTTHENLFTEAFHCLATRVCHSNLGTAENVILLT